MQKSHNLTRPYKNKIYPQSVRGRLRNIKTLVLIALLGIYYTLPWLRWERGEGVPNQAFLIDIVHRKIYIFNLELWAFEIYFLALLLGAGALGLFFITTYFGRLWCGFTCPQTVWVDLFNMVERVIEGDRNKRIMRDKRAKTPSYFALKFSKHIAWVAIALLTGGAWIFYYNDAPTTFIDIFKGEASFKQYFFIGLFALTTYVLGGLAKEKVCVYMCPWPRFQAAMLDDESYVVTYQKHRGEPRGAKKSDNNKAHNNTQGDCVDCGQCVAVCPMGIDIRDGLQLECIGCGLCIDACNNIMEKVGNSKWLINFDTTKNQLRKVEGSADKLPRIFRLRPVIYGLAIIAILVSIIFLLNNRASADIHIEQVRSPLYTQMRDGSIRNAYNLKILNKTSEVAQYSITAKIASGELQQIKLGSGAGYETLITTKIEPRKMQNLKIYLVQERLDAKEQIFFLIENKETDEKKLVQSVFYSPNPSNL